MTLPPPSGAKPKLKIRSDLDLNDLSMKVKNFSDFSSKSANLRPNVGPQTLDVMNEHPLAVVSHTVDDQMRPPPQSELPAVKRNRIFAFDREKLGFSGSSHEMGQILSPADLRLQARILSSKFKLLDSTEPLTCSNCFLIDKNLLDFSKHALWTAVLGPVSRVDFPTEPNVNVRASSALPVNATYGNCGQPCLCNSASSLMSQPAMLDFPAFDGKDL